MGAFNGDAVAVVEELPLPTWGTLDFGGGLREVTVVKAVEEYFSYHHLQKPLEAFRRDVERVGLKRTPSRASESMSQDIEGVLDDFDGGRRGEFAAAWEQVMPEAFRSGREGRALELRLQAHFATLRARRALQAGNEPDAAELQVDLEPFRAFLSGRGLDEVCGDEAMMPLFALPFVQRPYAQPHVCGVFTAKWLHDLRRDVEAALRSQQPRVPLLYNLLESQPSTQNDEFAWQALWGELFRIADSSLDAATMLAHGIHIPTDLFAKGRKHLELLREQVPGGFELRLHSELNHGQGVTSPSRSVRSRAATAPPEMPRDLDFGRLAQFVRDGPEERQRLPTGSGGPAPTIGAVLRALLQRLASAESPVSQRRGFLVAVACFDVLAVRSRPRVLPELLANPSLVELTLGILAVLACEAVGRSYIVENLACVEAVVEILKTQPLDSSLHIQALAAMQRLSLRRAPQDRMIELGLVDWVVGLLGWQGEAIQSMPSEFSLEFGSAMLMNLALRSAGKRKCNDLDTLTVALNLMEHWNPQIRTHINGTLYSLLALPGFRAQAKRAGLEGVLRSIHAQATSLGDELSRRQIEYLLEQLSPPECAQGAAGGDLAGNESGEDDEEDDENFLEEEELAGLLLGDRGGRSAEEALCSFRAAAAPAGAAEAQAREFRAFLGRGYAQRQ